MIVMSDNRYAAIQIIIKLFYMNFKTMASKVKVEYISTFSIILSYIQEITSKLKYKSEN